MSGPRRIAAWLLIGAVAGGMGGCDYFRPADPELPGGGELILTDYSSYEATLETIRLGLEAKALAGGTVAYIDGFAEPLSGEPPEPDFHHVFDAVDSSKWVQESGHTVPGGWNRALEEAFYIRFIDRRGEPYQMFWDEDDENQDEPGTDVAFVHRRYRIRSYSIQSESETTFTHLARGFADLVFYKRPRDGHWLILRWFDRPDPTANPDSGQVTLGRRRMEEIW